MLWRYIEQMLDLYKHVDGIAVVNCDGIVEYYINYRPEINHLTSQLAVKKHVLEVWPNLTPESSTLLRVLKTRKPLLNVMQNNTTCTGDTIHSINSTMPITGHGGELLGAVDVSIYYPSDDDFKLPSITVQKNFQKSTSSLYRLDDIITCSPLMNTIKAQIMRIAETNSSVLIYGATGSGKELIAQSIHTQSKRRHQPFVTQNCAAIPFTLLESLLFGTVKGSYTGAETKKGLFEMAQGGTLFLDEINSMELSMQSKILRVLEEKKIRRIGGEKEISFDVRLISAVNESPADLLSGNILRSDLYYRLSPVQIFLPSLHARREDIPMLVDHFIRHFNDAMHRDVAAASEEVLDIFRQYGWPGNVQELKNVIEGCFNIMSGKYIQISDLPYYLTAAVFAPDNAPRGGTGEARKACEPWETCKACEAHVERTSADTLQSKVNAYEKQLLTDAICAHKTLSATARALGVSKQGLKYKMEKYNLTLS